jgi:hypothetical protein
VMQVLVRLRLLFAVGIAIVAPAAWAATSDYVAAIAGVALGLLASVLIAWSLVPFVQANRDRKQRDI